MHSYESATNFQSKNGESDQIKNYIGSHPLNELLKRQSWNNIPICLKELTQLLVDALIGVEIHQWERKSLSNERLTRLQDLFFKSQVRMRNTQSNVSAKFKDMEKKIEEANQKISHDINKRISDVVRAQN